MYDEKLGSAGSISFPRDFKYLFLPNKGVWDVLTINRPSPVAVAV
jgi:hypothetical protein